MLSAHFEVDQACSLYLPAPSETDTTDTELNFVAPVAGKADLEGGWFEDETPSFLCDRGRYSASDGLRAGAMQI